MRNKIIAKYLSPLRYPGSKKKLVLYLYEIMKLNKLNSNVLVEPFVGGGSISLHFLLNGIVNKIIIADKDKLIYSFWKVLFSNPDYLIDFIKKVKTIVHGTTVTTNAVLTRRGAKTGLLTTNGLRDALDPRLTLT